MSQTLGQSTLGEPNQTTASASTSLPPTDIFLLKFSTRCRPFKLPEYPEIAQLVQKHFHDDQGVSVDYEYDYGEEVYIIETTRLYPAEQYIDFKVNKVIYKMKLEPQEPNEGKGYAKGRNTKKRDGVLLTFYKAGRKEMRCLSNQMFDNALQNDLKLELLKPTERQRIRGSQVFNGNKYAVVKRPDNMAKIPEMMPIGDPATDITHYIPCRCGHCCSAW